MRMRMRLFAVMVAFLVVSVIAAPPAERAVPGAPLEIGSQLELFVDHYLIDRLEGARLMLGQPQPAGTVLKADRPWEGAFNFGYQVIHEGGVYRMFYRGWSDGGSGVPLLRREPRRRPLGETQSAAGGGGRHPGEQRRGPGRRKRPPSCPQPLPLHRLPARSAGLRAP